MHEPVLVEEVISCLNLSPGDVVVDGTVGSGGHAEVILKKIGLTGRLIGTDQDSDALERTAHRLAKFENQVILKHSNFLFLKETLLSLNITSVSAVLLDIGISHDQLAESERGFSFLKEGPLDMRMDRREERSAYDVVNNASQEELADIFWKFGEERFSRRMARSIVLCRTKSPIRTTAELRQLIEESVPAKFRYGRTHPATRAFQALRIAVNRELEVLEQALPKAFELLKPKGRLAVISFHSLEDRIVKHFFVRCQKEAAGKIVTKKPVTPGESEIARNPMSRSAKLRAIERN